MNNIYRILAINPGSTSSKISLFDGENEVFTQVLRHEKDALDALGSVLDQKAFRYAAVLQALEENNISISTIDAVVGRGGIIRPLSGGVYTVSDDMVADLLGNYPPALSHPCGLGGLIAREIADSIGKPSYVVDPVVVDELEPVARISGLCGVERVSTFHALNQKAIAIKAAKDLDKPYEQCRLVVAHIGGGVSVAAHRYGRVVDVNNAIDGEGPFSPERSGGLPLIPVIEMCYSGKYTEKEMKSIATKNGGMASYINTSSGIACEEKINSGDKEAELIYDAMAYQIAKEIGAMIAVLAGDVDAVILTGGISYSALFTGMITKRIGKMAKVLIYPGEDEMSALVQGAIRVLSGESTPQSYSISL